MLHVEAKTSPAGWSTVPKGLSRNEQEKGGKPQTPMYRVERSPMMVRPDSLWVGGIHSPGLERRGRSVGQETSSPANDQGCGPRVAAVGRQARAGLYQL